ncbi:MAG: insulinase family protein [Clostridiales bacterium]|nr:insulinase family protein [Clostridiales bacterium]
MFEKYILDNGIKVVTYKMPEMKSVSVGLWLNVGSRLETPENNGVSHFIEHMLFKGTQRRSSKKISQIFDAIGGQLNAFTGKECTCFYTKTLSNHLELSIDVLSDMFFDSLFSENDIALERNVVLEEIDMYEDSPEELVNDLIANTVWKDSLGYPILGSRKNIEEITREKILDYKNKNYTFNRIVISVAGNFNEKELLKYLNKYFNREMKEKSKIIYQKNDFCSGNVVKNKEIEQAHICIAYPGLNSKDDLVYSMLALNLVLGGGMSSRLFQEIREKRGLAYSVFSYTSSYMKEGLFSIYAGCNPKNYKKVINIIDSQIEKLINKKLSNREINSAKEQLKGNFLLGLENTTSLMSYGGKSECLWNEIETFDEVLKQINDVSAESINEIIDRIFTQNKKAIAIVVNN